VKFAIRDGKELKKVGKSSGLNQIIELLTSGTFAPSMDGGLVEVNDHVLQDEIKAAIQQIAPDGLKKFKIAADPANGMGCIFLKELFKHVRADFSMINDTLDGTFPVHQPDPIQFKNLLQIIEKVKADKSDLGIAPDGDGDRVYFIDEKGAVIKATSVSSIVAKQILKKTPGETIIVDIRDIRNAQEVCKRYGGKFSMSIVGHAFITKQLNAEHAAFAGESSGHFYFREIGGAESSIRAILYMLKAMSDENKPISEIVSENMTSAEYEEKNFIIAPPLTTEAVLARLEDDYKDGQIDRQDKLSVLYEDWRFNVRTSNTENEPILRLNIEGATQELIEQKYQEIKEKLLGMGAKLKE
jgi:phosphomannomutase